MDDMEPMTKPPRQKSVVSKRSCICTTVLLSLLSCTLLFLMIMALNGTLAPIRLLNYVRPTHVDDRNEYAVVGHTMVQCRPDLAMRINALELTPNPLIMPDTKISNLNLDYDMTLVADVPAEIRIDVLIQRLEPPWMKVECVDGSGSCKYENACHALGKIFGFDSCLQMKAGNYSENLANQLIDLEGPFQWAKVPGNYFARVRVSYREQAFGCVDLTFRIRDRP